MTRRGIYTVLHAPCDTGDWWQLRNDKDGTITALSPSSADLVGFTLVIAEDTPEDLNIEHRALETIAKAKSGFIQTAVGSINCPYCLSLIEVAEHALKGLLLEL